LVLSQNQKAEVVSTRTLDSLDDELAIAGVEEGFPVQRRALAGELLADGWTADDVALVARHCVNTSTPAAGPRILRSLLGDPVARAERIKDLRHVAALRAARNAPEPWTPRPTEGEDEVRWAASRLAGIAYARVVADRADPREVAVELGVTVPELELLIERERATREPIVRNERLPDGDHAERVRLFREQHRRGTA
jgi:hypothetical protein